MKENKPRVFIDLHKLESTINNSGDLDIEEINNN